MYLENTDMMSVKVTSIDHGMNMINMKVMKVPALVMMDIMNMMDVILMIMKMNLIYLASTGSQQKSWILL